MATSTVSVYTRTTDANGKRRYELADHRTSYPMGTIFCLRYEVGGRRKWEILTGSMITLKYALARAKMRESDLLTGAINDAKTAPVVPVATEPEKPARLTLDQAIDRYLRNASTKSPRTYHGYTYTMKQFRESCAKQFLDEINKQDLYDFVTYLRVRGLGDRTISSSHPAACPTRRPTRRGRLSVSARFKTIWVVTQALAESRRKTNGCTQPIGTA